MLFFGHPDSMCRTRSLKKWTKAFGKERIWGARYGGDRLCGLLRKELLRPFRWNGLRAEEETITQFVEEDIRQHRGSVKMKVKGINGYQFEWYGFLWRFCPFLLRLGAERWRPREFYRYSLEAVFGKAADDIWYVMKNMLTIHESQMKIYRAEFPMARNKVEKQDIPRISGQLRSTRT